MLGLFDTPKLTFGTLYNLEKKNYHHVFLQVGPRRHTMPTKVQLKWNYTSTLRI